jgi:hypothetical protein
VSERLATSANAPPENERPPFIVELTVDGKRIALLFHVLSGKLDEGQLSLTDGSFDMFLRRADWRSD